MAVVGGDGVVVFVWFWLLVVVDLAFVGGCCVMWVAYFRELVLVFSCCFLICIYVFSYLFGGLLIGGLACGCLFC